MTENETLALHAAALDLFAGHVHRVRPDQWSQPTPCTDWSVRDLVNHMTVEQLWVPPLLSGATIGELGDRFDGDQLGDDPAAVWDGAEAAARAAFAEPGALDRSVHLSYGDSPAASYCAEMTVDAVVHSWDLARGIGADDELPEPLAEFALRTLEPQAAGLAASGLFAEPVPVPPDAGPQARLLGMTGRRPRAADREPPPGAERASVRPPARWTGSYAPSRRGAVRIVPCATAHSSPAAPGPPASAPPPPFAA